MTSTSTGMSTGPREVRAPRGSTITCKGWQQEAAMRMLMNNLDPEVAERPEDLVVYGGTGKAARSWPAFDAIVRELQRLEDFLSDGIYVVPETVADLPPLAGILTAGPGNPLSHVQLLARNLGIPNVAVDALCVYTNLPPNGAFRGYGISQLLPSQAMTSSSSAITPAV